MKVIQNLKQDMKFQGKKFIRRGDLTHTTRLYIAFTALTAKSFGIWGSITELSRKFIISRMFVYMLTNTLEEASPIIFGDNSFKPPTVEYRLPLSYMLSLRLEGRCSIQAISEIMKRFSVELSSVGTISQYLNAIGALLPNTLSPENNEVKLVVFLSDEIFSKKVPILVTVDPISSAILRIELADSRKVEDWKRHWECLKKNGYIAVYLVSDEGKSLSTAQKEVLKDTFRQPDTYHAIAHQLGKWVKILEDAAYTAIKEEYEYYEKLDSARSEDTMNKRISKYEEAVSVSNEKIELYENFFFLYRCIIEELRLFDENGNLRDPENAQENIKIGLELLETLKNDKIKKAIKKVQRVLPELFHYFDIAKSVMYDLKKLRIGQEALQALCAAWQWKKGNIKAKKAKGRQHCARNEELCLKLAAAYLQEEYEVVKEQVYMSLDQIVQSSALVECVNSIIRPYLNNSRNHITQGMLNLIMFYHNHRRYNAGKRKGKSPHEILTGKRQEKDWLELVLDSVEEKNPSLLLIPCN